MRPKNAIRPIVYNILAGMLFFFTNAHQLSAQISPKEGRQLNYRLIGFSFPNGHHNCKYKIEVASGNYNNEDSFKQNIVNSYSGDKNKIIGEVPSFGKQYTWRVITVLGSNKTKSSLYHFSTKINPDVDTSMTRLRITTKAKKYKGAYVFLDGTKTLYDMNGNPVWFLNDVAGVPTPFLQFRDLKITPQGTITFMTDWKYGMICEANYNGTVLWKMESADLKDTTTDAHFHHEFTRLPNGHYMVMGNEIVLWKLPAPIDSALQNRPDIKDKIVKGKNNTFYQRILLGTLIEYDEKGNIVWRWRSSQYFKQGYDVYYKTAATGIYEIDDTHPNSFYFDEKEKAIYVGFRDISRVLKVAYPGGEVLTTLGNPYNKGIKDTAKDLFCWQHCCRHSPNGYIYLYNNNTCHHGSVPKITIIQDQAAPNSTPKKLWEYECTVDGANPQSRYQFANGGSVAELPDSSIFVNMSHELYTKVFIVDRNKNYLWSAVPEKWDKKQKKWVPVFQYRASIITDPKDMERLIWNESNDK